MLEIECGGSIVEAAGGTAVIVLAIIGPARGGEFMTAIAKVEVLDRVGNRLLV
jgi:hypothetical protein